MAVRSCRWLMLVVPVVLIAAGCTSGKGEAATTPTSPAVSTAGTGPQVVPATVTQSSTPPISEPTADGKLDTPGTVSGLPPTAPPPTTTTHSPTPTPIIRAAVSVTPADGATGVSPIAPVVARVARGSFVSVSMTNPEGKAVKGSLSKDRLSWTSGEPLGYGRTYTLTTAAVSTTGVRTTSTAAFTTLVPNGTIYPSFFPSPDLKAVGVGQPMVVIFDKAPPDKKAAERALSVTTSPKVQGAWYWWDDRTVHYRAKDYWKPGTKITVTAKIYGIDLGGGVYGETDRTLNVTIGASKIATIDDATKQMKIYVNGTLTDTVPVSMGMSKTAKGSDGQVISFVTPSGTYVVEEKYKVKRMTSASYGLPADSSLGYDSQIPLAVRISDSGIFVHSAPWSVADQGVRNVSHGCININPSAAKWFYDNFSYGDIVTVTGTSTRLESWDGYGDWNIPWKQWLTGSALS